MSNSALFLVVLLTAMFLVAIALVIARFAAPKSYNLLKGEPYECGIPTRGDTWVMFKVGYYLFAILYIIFDIETMLLFPWAVVMGELGAAGLISIVFFLTILIMGLIYAWKKGALEWK